VIVFLDANLQPYFLLGDGSPGVFWLDKDACYTYTPNNHPGGFVLEESHRPWLPATPDELHQQLQNGMELSVGWEHTLALEDPKTKAKEMAKYLREATAPKGYRDELYRELRE